MGFKMHRGNLNFLKGLGFRVWGLGFRFQGGFPTLGEEVAHVTEATCNYFAGQGI